MLRDHVFNCFNCLLSLSLKPTLFNLCNCRWDFSSMISSGCFLLQWWLALQNLLMPLLRSVSNALNWVYQSMILVRVSIFWFPFAFSGLHFFQSRSWLFCVALISNFGCCTTILYAWPWGYRNTWYDFWSLISAYQSNKFHLIGLGRLLSLWKVFC